MQVWPHYGSRFRDISKTTKPENYNMSLPHKYKISCCVLQSNDRSFTIQATFNKSLRSLAFAQGCNHVNISEVGNQTTHFLSSLHLLSICQSKKGLK